MIPKEFPIDETIIGYYENKIAVMKLSTWINPPGFQLYVRPIYPKDDSGIISHTSDNHFAKHISKCRIIKKEEIDKLEK